MGKRVVVECAGIVQVFGEASQQKPNAHRNAESKHASDDDESPLSHAAESCLLVFLSGGIAQYCR